MSEIEQLLLASELAEKPDDAVLQHMYAATGGADAPDRASDGYLVDVFNSFSKSFDEVLGRLKYRAPEVIGARLARQLAGRKVAKLLDAGCGTGLSGAPLRPLTDHLVGIDISPGMLHKGAKTGLYDFMACAELSQHMTESAGQYDAIASADVFNYTGDLSALLAACRSALVADGVLCFSLELLDEASELGYRLQPHGRYAHERAYAQRVTQAAGFAEVDIEIDELRHELNQPVQGLIITAWGGTK